MPYYRVAGVTISTDLQLPELRETSPGEPSWTFAQVGRRPLSPGPILKEEAVDGRVWMRIFRSDELFAIIFPDVADFTIDPGERFVAFRVEDGVGLSTLRHLLLDLVLPCLLTLDGSLVLHASAVGTVSGAVVFSGPSGSGKSSLAAEFAQRGCCVMADDFVLLREHGDGFSVVPSYPGLRLWPDSAEVLRGPDSSLTSLYDGGEKQRVVSEALRTEPTDAPLAAIVLLDGEPENGPDVAIQPVPAREGMMALFGQAFRMERSGSQRAVHEFDQFARLTNSTALFRLRFPRDYGVLPLVREKILEELRISGGGGARTRNF